jgi:predicted Zn-dependent peptidase
MAEKIIKLSIKFIFLLLISFLLAGGVAPATSAADNQFTNPDKINYPPLKFNLPQTQRVVLNNGIVLYILEDHELPLVNINALIRTGTMYDPEGKEGVADLVAYVMRTGGTAKLESAEIDSRLDFMAASATITMSLDSAQVGFSVLHNDLDKGLDLLAQIIIQPAFEQKKLELAKELKKEDLRRLKDDPQRLAFREFNRLIYRGDPRGRFASTKSVSNIERADLTAFHRRFFQPNNIMFAVTGDITKEQAIDKIRHYFGSWKAESSLVQMALPPQHSNTGLYYINKEIPQSTIISGQFAVSKTDADFYAFTVFDFIAGSGGFPSRIFNAVRNNEGLAYSAGSFYRARPTYGVFGTYAFTKTSTTLKAFSLINSVLDNIKSGTLTGKELAWAKTSINNGFIFSFTRAEKIANQQMNIEYEKLPADYLFNYRRRIESITLKDVNRVAAKYLDKEKTVVLILGDTKQFDKSSTETGQPILITPED